MNADKHKQDAEPLEEGLAADMLACVFRGVRISLDLLDRLETQVVMKPKIAEQRGSKSRYIALGD